MNTNDEIKNELKEKNGEELLEEYLAQDKDRRRHNMGYSVYGVTHSECCDC